jgi:hypothetical protein
MKKININGKDVEVGDRLGYEDILTLAGEREGASVVCKPKDPRLSGFTVIRGQTVDVTDGMRINCIMTGNA